jgi:oxygen-dependent protoporphyrinogen oxidase
VTRRVVVVGGGVAGLATAYRLLRGGAGEIDVPVLEAEKKAGGKIRSDTVGGLDLEAGPDSLLARKPAAVELCRELGLAGDLLPPATSVSHIWTPAGLLRFPTGPLGISTRPAQLWRWRGMSLPGRLRAGLDLVPRSRAVRPDESLGSLLRRHLGDEATERLVGPLLGGLFAGDVDLLSAQATFPELASWERRYGSLILGARAAAKAARGRLPAPLFLRLRGGLRRLVDGLAEALGPGRVRCGAVTDHVSVSGGGYLVRAGDLELAADAVVLATPAFVTADLLAPLAHDLAHELRSISHVSTAVVLLVYAEGTGHLLPESSGFLVPRGKLAMTACTFVSRKWPDDEFGDRAVLRCFVGSTGDEGALEEPDEEIMEDVSRELAAILPLGDDPEAYRVVRWPHAMPQYELGHLDRVAAIERGLPAGVFVAGQDYYGTGIADCVKGASAVADRVRSYLS